jgi:hypothetical protein
MERITQRLNSETSKNSVNTDTFLKINVDSEERLLPPGEILNIVNLDDRFNKERQSTKIYRILGTINPSISNVLFNLSDSSLNDLYTWKGFNYQDPNTLSYRFFNKIYPTVLNQYLKEKDGWFGYFDPDISRSGFCNYFDMEPKRQRFSFLLDTNPFHNPNSEPVKNWDLTITYPASIDDQHSLVNGGLLIIDALQVVVGGRNMTAFAMPCLHNLVIGDSVKITGTNGYDGDHIVVRTGLDNGDLKNYYFVVDLPTTGTVSGNSRMKRVFGGVESTYYFRKFRRVKTRSGSLVNKDDYEMYKLAFSESYFNDAITQFSFNQDIDVKDLKDNLGRPITELYLTIIKTNSNNLFGLVSSGIESPFISKLNSSEVNTYLLDVPVINKIHNSTTNEPFQSHTPLESDVTLINGNNDFYGDLVEYNINELKETILTDVQHRFNTLNRETPFQSMSYFVNNTIQNTIDLGPRQEGYYYKAHHLIKIREFSSYVEQGDRFTVGIPDYAVQLDDGRYLWRDLLDIGINETEATPLDYPFLNGSHYMYNNYCFTVKRQDPFEDWNLYYSKFPADPIGESITDKFNTNNSEDVC